MQGFPAQFLLAQARIERIAKGIAKEVEGHNSESEGDAGRDEQKRMGFFEPQGVVDHAAPTGKRGLYAQAQEGEGRFRQNDSGDVLSSLNDDGTEQIRQNMTTEDGSLADA